MTTTAEETSPQNPERRLLERFALIAFGLYHLPLFLNNYPSLGGGGFSETGLAVSWGHVFTPPGVWVARHLFHLTGSMSSAYQGDNGDVGEEFGRLLLAIAIGLVVAVVWTFADRKRPRSRWVGDALKILLRYSIALGLASYAIAKLLPMQFPPLSAVTLEQRVGDLSPMSVLWSFMEASRPYAFFGGVMEMVVVVLLCFRRTATLGALICIPVMANVAALTFAYGVPVKLYSTMIVLSAVVLVLYDVPRLVAVFVTNRPVEPQPSPSFLHDRIPSVARWTIKVVLVGSVIVSSVVAMKGALAERHTASSPLDGAWVVTSFSREGKSLDSTANAARWRRLSIDGGSVVIRVETDGLSRCARKPSADTSTVVFTCSRGRSGEIHWTRVGDVLQLDGLFDGARVSAVARRVDYPLLGSGFRLVSDR
jgi:hypothetical protein